MRGRIHGLEQERDGRLRKIEESVPTHYSVNHSLELMCHSDGKVPRGFKKGRHRKLGYSRISLQAGVEVCQLQIEERLHGSTGSNIIHRSGELQTT